ncbi:hypothetical protein THAOC_19316, partial [Thalassiosira oceanica]
MLRRGFNSLKGIALLRKPARRPSKHHGDSGGPPPLEQLNHYHIIDNGVGNPRIQRQGSSGPCHRRRRRLKR